MGGLKLTFKLGPKKPASDGGEGGSGGSAPSAPARTLPSGPGGGAPHPFAAGARTGGGEAGASPSGARPKVPAALLKAKLERERAAAGAASRSAGGTPSEGATMKGVPKALLMKGVPKALQGGGKPAPGVSSGKVEKKKVKRPIPAGAGAVPGFPGVKIRLVSKPGGGIGAASAGAAAAAAMDSGYDSWGEGDDATPTASNLGTHKRARDAAASDDRASNGLVPGPVPAFVEPPPKPSAMLDVTKKLQAKDKHGVFAEPVTEAIAPGYFSVVATPMDFRTLRENIRLGKYQSWDAFVRDVELIFANAMAYNPAGTAVHALAAKTLELARRAAEKARAAGLSPGARAKRAKIAHVASMASFGGDERAALASVDDPVVSSRGFVGAPSSTGFEEEEDDDDEVGGGNDDDDKKKKKGGLRFKRHTFNELRSRTVMPSLAAWRRANALVETSSRDGVFPNGNGKPIPETPQAMVRPSATFFQKRAAAESYAGSLASWGASLRGRARVAANRLARAASSLIPPPPPRAPSPPPREPSPARAEEDELSALVAAENDDGSESDDDVSLISIAAKVRGDQTRVAISPILPAANAQKSLALAAAAAAASQRASASVKTAGLISRGQVAIESRGDPLPPLRAQLGLPPDGSFADVVRGVHADLSRGLSVVRDRLRGLGFGKEHPIVPAPPPLPATRRRT